MSYALVCTGAGHVTIPTKTTAAGALRICRFDIELTSYTTAFLYSSAIDSTVNNNIRINSATQLAVQTTVATTRTITLAADSIPLNTRLVIEVFRTAAPAFEVWVNGELKGSAAIGTAELNQLMSVNYIGASTNGTAKIRAKIYEADLFGNTYLNTSEPNASTWGDGELFGFPTDGTQWFEYASGGTTPITFSGTIPNQTFTNGDTVSVDLSTYFTGTQTPFSFANTGTALTGTGLTVSSAGILNGTATTGSITGAIVTGTDADLDTASSNAFNVTVNAAGDTTPPTFSVAPAVTDITQTGGTATAEIDETGSIFYVIVPQAESTPSVAQVIAGQNASGAAPIDSGSAVGTITLSDAFTGTTAGAAYKACFAARDDEPTPNVQAAVTVVNFNAAAAPVGTITIPDVVNNTDTPWASAAVDAATVMPISLGSVVVNKTGLSTTAGADLVITDAAIVTGAEYIIIIKIGTAYGWYRVVAT